MNSILYKPIGIIHSPFLEREGMPIQPCGGLGIRGHIELFEDYQEGLKDLVGFSHIILIYHFHESHEFSLLVKPFLDHELRGVFATRAPRRPNPIGMSVVALERIENGKIFIQNIDILDGTPLLDIKPYVPEFDSVENVEIGWLSKYVGQASSMRSDNTFE